MSRRASARASLCASAAVAVRIAKACASSAPPGASSSRLTAADISPAVARRPAANAASGNSTMAPRAGAPDRSIASTVSASAAFGLPGPFSILIRPIPLAPYRPRIQTLPPSAAGTETFRNLYGIPYERFRPRPLTATGSESSDGCFRVRPHAPSGDVYHWFLRQEPVDRLL